MGRTFIVLVSLVVLMSVGVGSASAEVIQIAQLHGSGAWFEFDTADGYRGAVSFVEERVVGEESEEPPAWLWFSLSTPSGPCDAYHEDFDSVWSQGSARMSFEAPCGHIVVEFDVESGRALDQDLSRHVRHVSSLDADAYSVNMSMRRLATATISLNGDVIVSSDGATAEISKWNVNTVFKRSGDA
jgi:hypothetical protein